MLKTDTITVTTPPTKTRNPIIPAMAHPPDEFLVELSLKLFS